MEYYHTDWAGQEIVSTRWKVDAMREIIYGVDDERPTTRENHLESCVGDYLYSLSADIQTGISS